MVFVGFLLLSGMATVAIEAYGYSRGGYGSAFWALPLDDKLDHVSGNSRYWWWISVWSLVGLFFMSAGVFGLVYLLADADEPVLAAVGLGGYVIAVVSWVVGSIFLAVSMPLGAGQRKTSGTTPLWMDPIWRASYVAEGVWILGANLAYIAFGIAILRSGLLPVWTGWAVVVWSALVVIGVVVRRDGFPQLGHIAPTVIGMALLIEYF